MHMAQVYVFYCSYVDNAKRPSHLSNSTRAKTSDFCTWKSEKYVGHELGSFPVGTPTGMVELSTGRQLAKMQSVLVQAV